MPVVNQVPEVSSTANGLTTVFPFEFQVPTVDDLVVQLDGVTQNGGFTVQGLGADSGQITFNAAPADGTNVTILRDTALERLTDYQQHGDFLSPVVNADFDRPILKLQELDAVARRTLTVAVGDAVPVFPPASTVEGQVFGVLGGVFGFFTPLDGTAATQALRDGLASADPSVVVGYLQRLQNALLRPVNDRLDDTVSVLDYMTADERAAFRAGTATDLSAACSAACAALPATGGTVEFPAGDCVLAAPIVCTNKPLRVRGAGMDVSRIIQTTSGADALQFVCTLAGNNVVGTGLSKGVSLHVENIGIHRRDTSGGSAIKAVWNAGTNDRPYFTSENLCIDSDVTTTLAFAKGLDLTNSNGTRCIGSLVIHGNRAGFDNTVAKPFLMTHAIHLQGDNTAGKIDHFFSRLSIGNANAGLQIDSWHEGVYIDKFEVTFVGDAFVCNGFSESGNPNLFILNGHVNVRGAAIVAANVKNLWLGLVDLYKDGGATADSLPGFAGNVVQLDACDDFIWMGGKCENTHSAAVNGVIVASGSPRGRITGVSFRGFTGTALTPGDDWTIGNNTYLDNNVGIFMAGTGTVVSNDNVFSGNGTDIVDSSQQNIIERRHFAETIALTLTGGGTTEIVNVAITPGYFSAKPSAAYLIEQDATEDIVGFYKWTTGSTATNAQFKLRRTDGLALNSGPHRFSFVVHA